MHPGDSVLLTLPLTMPAGGRVEYQGAVGAEMTVLPVGNYDATSKIDHIRRFRPRALYGSASYFGHLAALLGEDAKTSGVEVLLTGTEGAGLSFLKFIEDMWGAKAYGKTACLFHRPGPDGSACILIARRQVPSVCDGERHAEHPWNDLRRN